MQIAALLPAAGSGTRLGKGHKAFVSLAGKTLLNRCLEALCPHVDQLLIALPHTYELPVAADVRQFCPEKIQLVQGGSTRQQSVYNLLAAAEADVVVVHDVARPFLSSEIAKRLIDAAQSTGAATAALPVADTLVRANLQTNHDQAAWGEVVERADLWAVQTPQAFQRKLLWQAHQQALADNYQATDDAGLLARLGHSVELVTGDARLFKITTPSDLQLAEALVQTWDDAQ